LDDKQREDQVARLLQSEHVKYQDIDLGGGVATGGHRRTSMDSVLFGSDLRNLSLLDIGSSLGHFCLEALRHGAASATGLETSPERLRHAREIAEVVDPRARYIAGDFEEWSAPPQSYDVVLCLNVLHHLYDPIAAIRKIMTITARRFYLEVAPVSLSEIRKVANVASLFGGPGAPILLLGDTSNSTRAADRTFMFTRKAIATIINGHSKAYEPVLFHPSSFKGRWIVEARRRQIDHLVVVAGPTSVGKSTFIEALGSPSMRARFGIDDDFETVQANALDQLRTGPVSTLVFHYDMLRPFDRPLHSHGRDPAFHLLASANRITLITLANHSDALRARLTSPAARAGSRKALKRQQVIGKQYENAAFLIAWYEAWLEAADKYMRRPGDRRHLLLTDADYTPIEGPAALRALLSGDA
jgi:SAM-dependent methyltransferase